MAEGRSLTIALQQITYGLALIDGFSLGLASVLTSLGVAVVNFAGNITLPFGVLGHEGSTVLVTLSGLRLLINR